MNLLDRASGLFDPADPRRLSLLPTFGRALREHSQLDRADAVLLEAVERANGGGDLAVAADARVALSDLRFHRTAQTGVSRTDVLQELDEVVRIFERLGDVAGLARALTLGGKVLLWGGEAEAALRDLERAARHARDAGDRAQEAEALRYVCTAMRIGPTPTEEAISRVEEIGVRAEGNPRLQIALLLVRARFEAMRDCPDDARARISEANALADEHGLHSQLDSSAGEVELIAGDPAAAESELRASCARLEEIGELGFLSSVVPSLLDALYQLSRDEEALMLAERWRPEFLTVPEDVDAQVGWRRVRAKLRPAPVTSTKRRVWLARQLRSPRQPTISSCGQPPSPTSATCSASRGVPGSRAKRPKRPCGCTTPRATSFSRSACAPCWRSRRSRSRADAVLEVARTR